MLNELKAIGEDGPFVAECLLPDGTGGHVIEAPGAAGVVDEGLAGLIGGLDDGVADAAGALLRKWEKINGQWTMDSGQ